MAHTSGNCVLKCGVKLDRFGPSLRGTSSTGKSATCEIPWERPCASGLTLRKQGWLLKKGFGSSKFGSQGFKKRWVVLTPESLSYYKDDQGGDPKGVITFNSDCRCTPTPKGSQCSKDSRGKGGGLSKLVNASTIDVEHAFSIHQGVTNEEVIGAASQQMSAMQMDDSATASGKLSGVIPKTRTYYFAGDDAGTTDDWVTAVRGNIGVTRCSAVVAAIERLLKDLEVAADANDDLDAMAMKLYDQK